MLFFLVYNPDINFQHTTLLSAVFRMSLGGRKFQVADQVHKINLYCGSRLAKFVLTLLKVIMTATNSIMYINTTINKYRVCAITSFKKKNTVKPMLRIGNIFIFIKVWVHS